MSRGVVPYHVLIVRIWPESLHDVSLRWRLTLESPSSGDRMGFTDVHTLLDQLEVILTGIVGDVAAQDGEPQQLPPDELHG